MNRQLQFENETGVYHCDESGKLLFIEPRTDNCLYRGPFGPHSLDMEYHGLICTTYRVRDLIIPEGVRSIGSVDPYALPQEVSLRDTIVTGQLRFPSTLESLRENVLSGSLIMDMELPETVRHIGSGAIMNCYIQQLRLGAGLPEPEDGWYWKKTRDERWKQEAAGKLACGGRQFKETIIGTLVVPAGYPYKRLMPEAKIDEVITY